MPSLTARALCLMLLACCAPLAHAQVYHCVGVHGEPVFSGEPCGTPASPRSHATGTHEGLGGVCATSPQALRLSITDAFAAHDVNRLAGLILWRGMDQASARASLHALSQWLKQPLIGIAVAYPTGPPPAGIAATPPTSAAGGRDDNLDGAVPTAFEISTRGATRDFGVIESGGCWWLTF
jgi:hypothetical protein